MSKRRLHPHLPVLLLCLWPASVSAQSAEELRQARVWLENGVDHYRSDRYEKAVTEFRKALVVLNEPGLLWNIARSYEEVGDVRNAIHYFQQLKKQHPKDDSIPEAEKRIAALERQRPGILIVDCAGVPGAAVKVDGQPQKGCGKKVRGLAPGAHMVQATAVGRGAWQQEVVIEPGGDHKVRVDWSAGRKAAAAVVQAVPLPGDSPKPAPAASPDTVSPAPVEASGGVPTLSWVALASGGALMGVGAFMGWTSNQAVDDLTARKDEAITKADIDEARDDADSKALMANVLMPLGAVMAVTGVVLWMTAPDGEATSTGWHVGPTDGGAWTSVTVGW